MRGSGARSLPILTHLLAHSGRLEANELAAAFKKGGFVFPEHVLKRMIRVADKSNKNSITFDEFLHLTNFLEEQRASFRRADQDGNGKVRRSRVSAELASPRHLTLHLLTRGSLR